MERKINRLAICYTMFLIMLFLSGALSGVISELVYFLGFLLPLFYGLYALKDEKTPIGKYLSLDSCGAKLTLPLVFPTVALVMLVSVLTSLLIKALTGVENRVDVGNSVIPALFLHALLPAILEEALFRYLPMRMLAAHSKRVTVLLSAALFALIHHNLFSIPYAFLAGVIFMAIDLACDSVVPSVLLHFINNALSVGMLVFADNPAFAPTVIILTAVLSVISVAFIVFNRKKYQEKLVFALSVGEKYQITLPVAALGAICLIIAVVSIL